MNENHAVCGSDEWRETVRDLIIPFAVGGGELGDDVVEVGPGYGATTDVFRERVGHLTSVEIDPALAADLQARLADTNVSVIEGDATELPFEDDRFSGGVCFSMLHHVPTPELQDRLFAEVARVLQAGALFVACDSVGSDELRGFHDGDTCNPVDPATVAVRLEAAGFTSVDVETNPYGWAARARATA